jgi:hypothetical protein
LQLLSICFLLSHTGQRLCIVGAFTNGYGKANAFGQNNANRTDMGGTVCERHVGVTEFAALAVNDQMGVDAITTYRKDVLAIDILAGLNAQTAQNATVEVQQDVGMRRVDLAVGVELFKSWPAHFQLVSGRLQQAITAFLAGRAKVVALNEQHSQQGSAMVIKFTSPAFYLKSRSGL